MERGLPDCHEPKERIAHRSRFGLAGWATCRKSERVSATRRRKTGGSGKESCGKTDCLWDRRAGVVCRSGRTGTDCRSDKRGQLWVSFDCSRGHDKPIVPAEIANEEPPFQSPP